MAVTEGNKNQDQAKKTPHKSAFKKRLNEICRSVNTKVNTGLKETILDRLSASKKLFERGIDSKTEE